MKPKESIQPDNYLVRMIYWRQLIVILALVAVTVGTLITACIVYNHSEQKISELNQKISEQGHTITEQNQMINY